MDKECETLPRQGNISIGLTPLLGVPIVLISDVIKNTERDLFNRITDDIGHVISELLPPKSNRPP